MLSKKTMLISIIGRPNVGKSSLFNCLMRKANGSITMNKPGVTRDRHYGITTFDDFDKQEKIEAILVDTGGFYPQKTNVNNDSRDNVNRFFNIMIDHAKLAIEESDLVLFVMDVREGIMPFDLAIADYIRSKKKEFWAVINKYDSDKQEGQELEFYSLGIDQDLMFVISTAHGLGLDRLRTAIHQKVLAFDNVGMDNKVLQKGVIPREKVVSKLAIIGGPNVGKSTLLNRLIGTERALVSEIPGTTVDPIEGFFDLYFGKEAALLDLDYTSFNQEEIFNQSLYPNKWSLNSVDDTQYLQVQDEASCQDNCYWRSIHIVDTAGIRRQKSIHQSLESQSVFRSLRSITESDIVLYVVDASIGITHQDRRLIDVALEKGKSLVVCLNKIDLLPKEYKTHEGLREWIQNQRDNTPWIDYCDFIPLSAKRGKYIKAVKEAIKKTVIVRTRKVPTGLLNRTVSKLVSKNSIQIKKGGHKTFKIKYASMIKSDPPTFIFFTNKVEEVPQNYRRYLQNGLRKEFLLYNTPVHIIFRN